MYYGGCSTRVCPFLMHWSTPNAFASDWKPRYWAEERWQLARLAAERRMEWLCLSTSHSRSQTVLSLQDLIIYTLLLDSEVFPSYMLYLFLFHFLLFLNPEDLYGCQAILFIDKCWPFILEFVARPAPAHWWHHREHLLHHSFVAVFQTVTSG